MSAWTPASALHLSWANPFQECFFLNFPPAPPLITMLCFPTTRTATLWAGSALLSPLLCQSHLPWDLWSFAAPFIPASGGTGPVPAGRSLGTGGACLPAKVNSKPPSNRNLRSHWEGRGTELSHPLSFHLCPEGGGFSSQLSPTPGRST